MPQIGPLARSVADLALALRLIAGPDGQEWEVPPVPLTPAPERPLRTLRLAWADDFGGVVPSADTRVALERLVGTLASLGATVERALPHGARSVPTVPTRIAHCQPLKTACSSS
jgi:amidase